MTVEEHEEEAAYWSDGGSNAFHLKKRFAMVVVEPSAGMRAVNRRLNPECEHIGGDMRSLRLAPDVSARNG